jgi:hypothetical protein
VDLGGWSFLEGIPFTFPAGTAMGPGEYLVIARDPTALEARFGKIDRLLGPWGAWPGSDRQASLSNDGADLTADDLTCESSPCR